MYITGGEPLRGRVRVSGAKTDVLSKLAATLLFDGAVSLVNVPGILDVRQMTGILQSLGARVTHQADRVTVNADELTKAEPAGHLVEKIRHSFCLAGPLLARVGEATMPAPGGCNIGKRPVDFHMNALRKMGADVIQRGDRIAFSLGERKLRGATICLDNRFRSAGTTNHIMTTATVAEGDTHILNACMEPETVGLGQMLVDAGADIEGLGTNTVTIHGRRGKLLRGGQFRVIGDRQEAGTFMLAAAATGGDVRIEGIAPPDVGPVLQALAPTGVRQTVNGGGVYVSAGSRLSAQDIRTGPYPEFPSDMQPLWTALMTQAEGAASIVETIFESRTGHVSKLGQMGANMAVDWAGRIQVCGGSQLRGVEGLVASDIREGAALVIAALCADGVTTLDDAILCRGYEGLSEKLRDLGANIE